MICLKCDSSSIVELLTLSKKICGSCGHEVKLQQDCIKKLQQELTVAQDRIEKLEVRIMDMGLRLIKIHIKDTIEVYKRLNDK